MYYDCADVVWVSVTLIVSYCIIVLRHVFPLRFKGFDFLAGIPIDHSELEVIASANDPILPLNESASPHGDIGELEGFDDSLGFV